MFRRKRKAKRLRRVSTGAGASASACRGRSEGSGDEWAETRQRISIRGLENWLEAGEAKTERERVCAEAIVAEAVRGGGWLTQKYKRRRGAGRWYAMGRAQLQSVSRRVRTVALKGQGVELDMDNAYVTLLIAATETVKGRQSAGWQHMRKYAGDKRSGRRVVAEGFGTTTEAAKNLFLTLMFGGTVRSWARRWHVDEAKACESRNRSEGARLAFGFASEVRKASSAILEGEKRHGEKPATTLQRRLSRMEEEVMGVAKRAVEARGFAVGTLIHDALIVNKKGSEGDGDAERSEIAMAVECAIQGYVNELGWRSKVEGGVSFTAELL
jgi:hypothetical protein